MRQARQIPGNGCEKSPDQLSVSSAVGMTFDCPTAFRMAICFIGRLLLAISTAMVKTKRRLTFFAVAEGRQTDTICTYSR
jgi:hypothetical protein